MKRWQVWRPAPQSGNPRLRLGVRTARLTRGTGVGGALPDGRGSVGGWAAGRGVLGCGACQVKRKNSRKISETLFPCRVIVFCFTLLASFCTFGGWARLGWQRAGAGGQRNPGRRCALPRLGGGRRDALPRSAVVRVGRAKFQEVLRRGGPCRCGRLRQVRQVRDGARQVGTKS